MADYDEISRFVYGISVESCIRPSSEYFKMVISCAGYGYYLRGVIVSLISFGNYLGLID
ncbi:hypothetical protein ES703_114875 [subsurface metagenome]